ncbi:MAG: hypothetical protein LC802_12560 [Acidobacteria bacterium]|nr:hypothetical protein [Acidobacteriota bacterium]
MTDEKSSGEVTEYHVVYVDTPAPRWEVRWGKRRMGYQAWDKRVALSAATEMAKADRPSKVVIHGRKTGEAEKEIDFDASAPKRSKGVQRKAG